MAFEHELQFWRTWFAGGDGKTALVEKIRHLHDQHPDARDLRPQEFILFVQSKTPDLTLDEAQGILQTQQWLFGTQDVLDGLFMDGEEVLPEAVWAKQKTSYFGEAMDRIKNILGIARYHQVFGEDKEKIENAQKPK